MKRFVLFGIAAAAFLTLAGCSDKHAGAIEASGTLEAVEVNVSAKVAGQVQSLFVDEGSIVKAGDTLAILDHATNDIALQQAKAGVDLADAEYRLLVNGARSEDLRQAEQALRQTASSYKTAKDDYERIKALYATKSVTQKERDDAESRYTIAQAANASAEQYLQKLKHFARPEDLAAAKARLNQAISAADLLRKEISDAHIIAPVSGTVTHKPVEVGELVSVGTTIVTISRLETLNLMIYVGDTELGRVKLGGSADLVIDTYPDRNFPAKVIYISPIAEFTPKNVQTKEDRTKLVFGVKLEVDNKDGILKGGMPVDAYLK
ncbi:MAG TPA: efflux RND transporter periplasmic adaptor subunit [Bacteroidota bacterium]|nr:efflux RND transporter periplasmic adaptor subunit [Bacteroidota bacterium]